MGKIAFKRIILKLSGEALAGSQGFGIDPHTVKAIAEEIKEVVNLGIEVAIVVGGGIADGGVGVHHAVEVGG